MTPRVTKAGNGKDSSSMIRIVLALCAIFLASSAAAQQPMDIKGKLVLIGATKQVPGKPPQRVEFILEGFAGIYAWWLEDGACVVNNLPTPLSVEYGPQAQKSGSLVCDVLTHGTASSGSRDDRTFSYTSQFRQNGNTLTLSGQAKSLHTITMRSRGTTEAYSFDLTTRQSMVIRIVGSSCEVTSFRVEKTGTTYETASDGRSSPPKAVEPETSTAIPGDCRIIPKDQWKPTLRNAG